uniref:Uncharacterized protein n=1 Tax=Kalanchoe fedtschenkoi TaxID=63787 RepID=A0A7N1A8R9_KALFE
MMYRFKISWCQLFSVTTVDSAAYSLERRRYGASLGNISLANLSTLVALSLDCRIPLCALSPKTSRNSEHLSSRPNSHSATQVSLKSTMDNKESAVVGFVGRPTREQGALIDAATKELDDEVLSDEHEALLSKPESSKKNDEQDQQQLSKSDEVCEREAKLDERAEQLHKKAEELSNKEEELQKKAEELNNKEEELKKKDVNKQGEHLWSEMHEGFLKTQETVQNLQTQVGSLAKDFSQIIPLSSQSSAAGGMEMEMPRTTTTGLSPVIVIYFQPATHSHSVVVYGDPQGNRVVFPGAAMQPIVPAYHSTQIISVPCGHQIQVVPLGSEPLAPAAYHSTRLTTPQPESGNGCGTSSSSGDGHKDKGEQHS